MKLKICDAARSPAARRAFLCPQPQTFGRGIGVSEYVDKLIMSEP